MFSMTGILFAQSSPQSLINFFLKPMKRMQVKQLKICTVLIFGLNA
jgi:hypothetical protein